MSKVLIFGLSSQVGDALLPLLRDALFQLTSVSRQKKLNEKNIVWQQADFSNFKKSEKICAFLICENLREIF